MERFTCRTCLSIADTDTTFQIFEKCSAKKTIKDVLLQYVPRMESTLSEQDRICSECLNTLKNFLNFIDKCLEIEAKITKEHSTIKKIEKIGCTKRAENEEIQVIENIEIVLEDELKSLLDKATTSTGVSGSSNVVDHDHPYIKPQITDSDESVKIKSESINNQTNCFQGILSTDASCEQDESVGELSSIQIIPVTSVTNEVLEEDVNEGDKSPNDISPRLTIIATGDELIDPRVVQIKEESSDSLMDDSEAISYYQSLQIKPNIYVCDLCGDAFLSQTLLQQHFLVHGEIRIMCDKCPKHFKTESALKAHYKLKHLGVVSYKCEICGHRFCRIDYLRNHLKRHEDEKNKDNIKCRIPGKFLRFKNTEDPLPCKICGKYYNGIQKLKVHLQTHLVVKRFACEYCDLTYKRWPSLKRHEKTHLESDTYFHRCNVCWKRFIKKEELETHMNQHGNPRYRCQVCDEQFHRKYLFDNHYLLSHATPEDIENSKKEVIYDTLLELSNQNVISE